MISNSLRYCSSLKEVTFLLMVHSKPHSLKSYCVVSKNLNCAKVCCIPRVSRNNNLHFSYSHNFCSKSPSDKPSNDEINKSNEAHSSTDQKKAVVENTSKYSLPGTKSTTDPNYLLNAKFSSSGSRHTTPGQPSSSEYPSNTTLGISDATPYSSVTQDVYSREVNKRLEDWSDMFKKWYTFYQDAAGISEVQRAQEKVNRLMDSMSELSTCRRELQEEQAQLHLDLDSVHSRITDTPRYSDEHTALFEQARQMNNSLQKCKREFEKTEGRERDCLMQVMSAIRVSHETERAQQQHTNYRTVAMSLVSAALASVVTFIANLKRTRDTNSRIEKTELHANSLHQDSKGHVEQLGVQVKALFSSYHAEAMLRLQRLEAALQDGGGMDLKGKEAMVLTGGLEEGSNVVTKDTLRTELNSALAKNYSALGKVLRKLVLTLNRTHSGSRDTVGDIASGSDFVFGEEEDRAVAELGEGFPVLTEDDFDHQRPSSSLYSISVYMATGAIIGTLMTAVACGGFK